MEVVPYIDFDRTNPLVNVMANESLGTDSSELEVERLGDDRVDAQVFQRLDLLFKCVEEAEIRFRLEHASRMRFERIEDRFSIERPRPIDHEFQDRLMATMHTIEIAEGQNRTYKLPTQIRNATKDLQVLSSSANMTSVRILSHYFIARFLGLFLTVLVASILVLAIFELVLNLDDLSGFGSAARDSPGSTPMNAVRYVWVRLASYYLADLLPLASFFAVFITFAWAGRSMELVAAQSGGIRLHRLVLPVLATALILSFATAILHETLILHARQIWASAVEGSHDQPDFGREAFWYHKGRTITNITSADPETRTLLGVEIFERGPNGTIIRVIRGERVRITDDGVWHLDNAAVWTFDPEDTTTPPALDENSSMALDLDALGGDVLLGADPGILPLRALAIYLNANPRETSSNLRRLRGLYHERLSSPWLVFVFACLALPFALRVDQRGRFGGPAAAAIAALGVFYLLQTAGTTISRQEFLPVGLTPWLVIAVALVGTSIALRKQSL